MTYFQTSMLIDQKKALWRLNDGCIDLIEGTIDLPIPNHQNFGAEDVFKIGYD